MEIIKNGNMQAMYKAYEAVIPPHGKQDFNTAYQFFTCIEANERFNVRFSSSVGYTEFEQGLYARFNNMMDYLLIENPNESPLVIKFGVGSGSFEDNRLTVTGNVKTEAAQYSQFSASSLVIAEGHAEVAPAQRIIIQNNSDNPMRIGAADGLILQPAGTFEYSLNTPLIVYGTDGDSLAVGRFD